MTYRELLDGIKFCLYDLDQPVEFELILDDDKVFTDVDFSVKYDMETESHYIKLVVNSEKQHKQL